jgi:phosphatidate cytidylyltransferase
MTERDPQLVWIFAGVFAALVIGSFVGGFLARVRPSSVVDNLNQRIRAWWVMSAIFGGAAMVGPVAQTVLFGIISFLALREFITITPTRAGDHRALFWVFFVITPVQYLLVDARWYGLFSIFIPVYAFLLLPVRSAVSGDCGCFMERAAKIQWALMICVYCVSHAPALLMLEIPGYQGQNAKLLVFLVVVAQSGDVLQYIFGKLFGRHPMLPRVSPNKTVEGMVGGVIAAGILGMGLFWMTPFSPLMALVLALAISLMGTGGGVVMSAVKRDRGIKDYGTCIGGHGGIMDRMDSLCFAAPIFFHLCRFYYT